MKNVILTGAGKGLGLEMTKELLKAGIFHVNAFTRSRSKSLELLKAKYGNSLDVYYVDINQSSALSQILEKKSLRMKKIDVLINNAAIYRRGRLAEHSDIDIDLIMETNLISPIKLTKLSLPKMKKGAVIVNINSIAGLREMPEESIYSTSKWGLRKFFEILEKEIIKDGIRVMNIHPGGINTSLWHENNPYPGKDVGLALSSKYIAKYIIDTLIHMPTRAVISSIAIMPISELK